MTEKQVLAVLERRTEPYSKIHPFIGWFRTVQELFDHVESLDKEKKFYPKISQESRTDIINNSKKTSANFLIFGSKIAPEDPSAVFNSFKDDILENLAPDVHLNIFIFCDYLNTGAQKKFNTIFMSLAQTRLALSKDNLNYMTYWFYPTPDSEDEGISELIELFQVLVGDKSIITHKL